MVPRGTKKLTKNMRMNSVENRYRTTSYKIKAFINKGVPTLNESEKREYDALCTLAEVLRAELKEIQKTNPKKRGGAQPGAGRPKRDFEDKKLTCSISIYPATKRKMIEKYGSLTKAIETILGEN